ncbi:MAG TPA: S24 family peptidase, partial [Sphingobium sp.]
INRTEADLRGGPASNAIPVPMEGASAIRLAQDLPIYGTALGADRIVDDHAVEQTYLNTGDVIGYAKRPTILDGRADAYGIYVQGSSMSPAHEDGALILVETKRPPRVGDDIVIYLRSTGEEDMDDSHGRARCVMVKRLVRRSASYIELEQFSPRMTFRIETTEIVKFHRVMTLSDLIS